ncbi:hypothetical protein V5O48_015228 [Marasmius crinis-equi]|uniref:Cytochrome P450 n=1 Tax=Marasmius crinis-equi TaxID=585013 RepID=A0ABR3EVE6_9AGAR
MSLITYFLYLPLASVATFLALVIIRAKRRSLSSFLRGPPAPSYLLGNENDVQNQMQVGQLTFKWFENYGTAFRAKSCWDEDVLMTCDPRAIQHIFQTNQFRFRKAVDTTQASKNLFGEGLASVEGAQHQRQRKIMTPAFSANQMKPLSPFFSKAVKNLVTRWKNTLRSGDSDVIDTVKWFPNMTLDILGESVFDYEFGALDAKGTSELANMIRDLFLDTKRPSQLFTLYRNFRRSVPDFVANFLMTFPLFRTKEDIRWGKWLETSKATAQRLFKNKLRSKTYEENDILGVLARSTSEDARKNGLSLSDNEALCQLATIILAGHETSASTLTWILYQLSQKPADQERILQEIKAVREKNANEEELTPAELDSMPFLNATIKESLRLNPIVFQLFRESLDEDVIPLSTPVTTPTGASINEIPIAKHQRIYIDVAAYNRLKQVWGEDAEEWNPERFMEGHHNRQTTLGVYANMFDDFRRRKQVVHWSSRLTHSYQTPSVLEVQVVLAGLIEAFEFSFPKDTEVIGMPAGFNLPFVVGEWHKGPQMPLHVRIRESGK